MLIITLGLAALASHFISTRIYNRLVQNEKKGATTIRVVSFIASFLIIIVSLFLLFIYNIRIER